MIGEKYLAIQLSFDELTFANPLRSNAQVRYKNLAGYFRLLNLPTELQSILNHVFSFLLVPSKHFMRTIQTNLNTVIMDELLDLENHGITFKYKGNLCTMKVVLFNTCGDNLGIHQIHGFLCSFGTSVACCRMCTARGGEFKKYLEIPPELEKNKYEYEDIISRFNHKEMSDYGLKSGCVLNKLSYFHVMDVKYVDIMHDLWEGHCRILVLHVMDTLYKKYHTNRIEAAINQFEYKVPDSINRPSPYKYDSTKKEIMMTSSAMKTFVMLLPIMVSNGSMDIKTNIYWRILLKLQYVIDLVLAPKFDQEMLDLVDKTIKEYIALVASSSMRFTIKTHLLLHYVDVIKQLGPLRNISSMRYEAKHNYHKQYERSSRNHQCPERSILSKESFGMAKLYKDMENRKSLVLISL